MLRYTLIICTISLSLLACTIDLYVTFFKNSKYKFCHPTESHLTKRFIMFIPFAIYFSLLFRVAITIRIMFFIHIFDYYEKCDILKFDIAQLRLSPHIMQSNCGNIPTTQPHCANFIFLCTDFLKLPEIQVFSNFSLLNSFSFFPCFKRTASFLSFLSVMIPGPLSISPTRPWLQLSAAPPLVSHTDAIHEIVAYVEDMAEQANAPIQCHCLLTQAGLSFRLPARQLCNLNSIFLNSFIDYYYLYLP